MNHPATAHFAVVLAAGGSRRLGHPKQLLTREGETLVHRAVRLAAATGPQRLLLVVGAYGERVVAAVAGLPCEILFNHAWDEGLASSLRMAAGALGRSDVPVLIAGCDQPALELPHLQRLLARAKECVSGTAATSYGSTIGIPVVAGHTLLLDVLALQGDRGLRDGLQRMRADELGRVSAPELAFDVDTDVELEKAIHDGLLDPLPAGG